MKRPRRGGSRCGLCGSPNPDSYMCADCGRSLRELLIGNPTEHLSHLNRAQPGIVWYVKQLYKTAYRQTRLGGDDVGAKATNGGYGLLADRRATELLARIAKVIDEWDGRLAAVKDRHGDDRAILMMEGGDYVEALCIRQARSLAVHVRLLRRHDKDVVRLHNTLLEFAREAWVVINPQPNRCCGGCPQMVVDKDAEPGPGPQGHQQRPEKRCGVILYAEEDAKTVRCPKCRTDHDVEELREGMREAARDYVLPAAELMTLMETRLNDRIPPSSFYALIRDGRLSAHSESPDGVALYTYQDVVEAREKELPVTGKRKKR